MSARGGEWICHSGHTLYAQVSAKEGLGHVDVFDLDLDVVDLAVGLLGAFELAAGS